MLAGMPGSGFGVAMNRAPVAEKMAQQRDESRTYAATPAQPAAPTRVTDAMLAELHMILERTVGAQERTAMVVQRAFGPTPESAAGGNPNGQIGGGSLGEISIALQAINGNLAALHANLDRIEQIV